jgi:hypothetical protein
LDVYWSGSITKRASKQKVMGSFQGRLHWVQINAIALTKDSSLYCGISMGISSLTNNNYSFMCSYLRIRSWLSVPLNLKPIKKNCETNITTIASKLYKENYVIFQHFCSKTCPEVYRTFPTPPSFLRSEDEATAVWGHEEESIHLTV